MENGESSYRRFLDGDKGAFDEIMRAHFDHVVFFVDSMLRDTHAAEDVAIDVFAYLAFKKGYDGRSSMRTYLLTVARSRALNYLRKRRSHPEVSFEDLGEEDADRAALEEQVFRDERKRLLHRAIEALPEEQRSAVRLVYFEELSYEDAARVMKVSKKRIDNLLYRAKNALRLSLGENGRSLYEEF